MSRLNEHELKEATNLPSQPYFRSLFIVLTLIFLSTMKFAFAQSPKISGKILDEEGKPLSGVSVINARTNASAVTDKGGSFHISAVVGDSLRLNAIGYLEQSLIVNDQSDINFTMTPLIKKLDDVIVVGYGTQRKEAVTGAVATISGKSLNEVPSANPSQALQGRLAGIQISQNSSTPGSTMQIRIRGVRSLTADNNPLIVLDGIPFMGSIADINPNDVKSIDVLKDASATAIYGSRGANGVILISTNRGNKGRKATLSYNPYYAVQTVFSKYPMMNGPEFVALRKAAGLYTNGLDESDTINTNWQNEFYRTGYVNNQDINISGGSETGSYNIGLSYYDNQGVIPTQDYKRYNLRIAIDQQINNYIKVGITSNNKYNKTTGTQVGLYGILAMTPISSPYNADGSLKTYINGPLDVNYVLTKSKVEQLTKNGQWINESTGYATYNSIYGEAKIPGVDGLKYRLNLGLDYIQGNSGNYTGTGINSATPTSISSAGIGNNVTTHWTIENILTYDKIIAKDHKINFTGLFSSERNKYVYSSMSALGIPSDALQYYNLGQATGTITVDPGSQAYSMWGLRSFMGRIMYSYKDKYMLSATLRSDASSRLAEGHKSHTYPAISAGWNIANEAFMSDVSWINSLKLRVGYGQTSNQAISPYSTLGALSTRPYNFGPDNYATGYYVSSLANANLGWEYSTTWNYGLDFALLHNRLTGTVEYYTTNTKDLLLGVNLPPTTGVTYYTANIGSTQNKGFELTLNGTIIDNSNGFSWDIGMNLYTNRNKITALANGATQDVNNAWFVGHPINVVYDYQKIGLWNTTDKDYQYLQTYEPGGNVGMIKVAYKGTYNSDGSPTRPIGADDRQILNINPKFQGGFNTRLSYKGFDLNVVGMFQHGGILISTLYGSGSYLNSLTGRRGNVKVDYWTEDNTDAKYPNPNGIRSSDNPKYGNTLSYFDGSYTKIRTITLGYNLNQTLLKSSSMKIKVYATVQNPFVMFSPYHKATGLDPETNSTGDQNQAVSSYQSRILVQGFNAPALRNYIIGANITF